MDETIGKGINFFAGTNENKIIEIYDKIESNYEDLQAIFKRTKGIFGKGDTARRIINILSYTAN